MARKFLVPVELPGDASAALYAVPRQQLDAQIATRATVGHTHGGGGLPGGWVDVKAAGALGNGLADDAASIQAAINASPVGSTVWFPPGTYLAGTTIRLLPNRTYLGAGGLVLATTIKAAAGLTTAVLAAQGWWDSAATCDAPIRVEGLQIDGSGVSGVHGLVIYNFWSRFTDIQVASIAGASAKGIYLTDKGRNGTTITSNSHSENTITACRFDNHTGGATAIWGESNSGISNQDGRIESSFFSGITGYGIRLDRAAGWYVERNHLYGIGYSAILLGACYATTVTGNYVEDFGGQNLAAPGPPTDGYYSGIGMTVLDTRTSVLSGNTVTTAQPTAPAGNRWDCYNLRAGSGQLRANIVVEGNAAAIARDTAPTTARSNAWWLGEGGDTGRDLRVQWGDNLIEIRPAGWWQGTRVVNAAVTLTEPGVDAAALTTGRLTASRLPIVLTASATGSGAGGTLATDASLGSAVRRYTSTGAVTIDVPTNPADDQVIKYKILASGGARAISFATGIRISTGVTRGPYDVPAGEILEAQIEYSTLITAWTLTAATISAT